METSFISGTDRQNQILQLIENQQRLSVADICEQFAVSEATARRDLEVLAGQGKIQRVHGGAIALTQAPPEQPILQRQDEQAQEKVRIGQAAAALVGDGETVFLGSGTTVLEAARALRDRRNLTVITNSMPVVNALAGTDGMTIVCLGGMLRDSELSFIGHITEQALAEVRADKVIIGTRAISLEHGLTHEYLPETMTDRAILKSGREIIVVADHTKFGRAATVLLAPLERIQTIVTDKETPRDFLDAVLERGIQVVVS
ncbi:MAG TPA: DeoR/GlpR family DNA-binding transcription regulator [Anaerolineales bacterium]|nr:DeoR/GlpR family DNA-binding transcription regulator [Anaerolineales bacterium]